MMPKKKENKDQEVQKLVDGLAGNGYDMAGLRELQKMLGSA